MLTSLLPLQAVTVTLRFTESVNTPFYHQPALTAFIRSLADSPPQYDTCLWLDAVESGHTSYNVGDAYRFSLFALPGQGEAYLETLFKRLQELPHSTRRRGQKLYFRDNLELISLHDFWHGGEVDHPQQLTAWTPHNEAQLWQAAEPPLIIRWLVPTRLLLPKEQRIRHDKPLKGEARYCRGDNDLDGTLWLTRLHDSIADLIRRRGAQPTQRTTVPEVSTSYDHLFWVDGHYRDENAIRKLMGGMSGMLQIMPATPLSEYWSERMVLGQYLGIGQYRAFGWGRYRLETSDGTHTCERTEPATTLLQRAARMENLRVADTAVRANQAQSQRRRQKKHAKQSLHNNNQHKEIHDQSTNNKKEDWLQWLQNTVSSNKWQAATLRGHVITKPNGEPRILAIPPLVDRVVQRAVAQVLRPGIDNLLSCHSYGYRHGLSRRNAADAIQSAWREGYRWVYESDIDDFFDSVNRDHLAHRLASLYPDDPINALLLAWMQAPIIWDDQPIERVLGVPQGSPLSPLMTNLLLDDFDSDLDNAGFRMIRFADDFVVVCKNPEQAQKADQIVRASLADLGLRINQDKTRIVSFAEGFRYLGYLFLNDLVLDVGGKQQYLPKDENVPPSAWMARMGGRTLRPMKPEGELGEPQQPSVVAQPATAPIADMQVNIGQVDDEGTVLVVSGESALISSRAGHVRVSRQEQEVAHLPWERLATLLLVGPHHITTPALRKAMSTDVPVHFITTGGHYQGVCWSGQSAHEGVAIWTTQQRLFANRLRTLPLAKTVVCARIRHMREVLRQRNPSQQMETIRQSLQRDIADIECMADEQALHGIEGIATRRYIQALQTLVPDAYVFKGRNRRPPRDPFNALLSLGYTILYSHTESMIRVTGLLPWCGFYHKSRGRHAALASDLMEPFRHLVERTALRVVQRGMVCPGDFSTDDTDGTRLHHDALKCYLQQLERRFLQPVRALGETDHRTLHGHLYQQGKSLRQWLRGKTDFQPFVMR